jgi:hypothetical protein
MEEHEYVTKGELEYPSSWKPRICTKHEWEYIGGVNRYERRYICKLCGAYKYEKEEELQ